jgi:hypothetical protein
VKDRLAGSALAGMALVLSTTGCALLDDEPKGAGSADSSTVIGTRFTKIAPQGFIDLSLDLTNPGEKPVALGGRLVAVDSAGEELSTVQVTTAYGSERGRMILMPGVNVDFVQLGGPGADLVEDVVLSDQATHPVDVEPAAEVVDLVPLGDEGEELEYDATAVAARVDNPNAVPVDVRVVLLVLGASRPGEPQEAIRVEDVAQAEVPASDSTTVALDNRVRKLLRRLGTVNFVSLRAVFSPPT